MTVKIRTPQTHPTKPSINIFLAGSIENGVAENWQSRISNYISDRYGELDHCKLNINNPRRDDWNSDIDPTSKQDELVNQINWELDELEKADVIVMYFDPSTKSPISLLELGLFKDKNIFVYCTSEFWRSTNVEVVCERFGVPFYDKEEDMVRDVSANIDFVLERRGW